MNIKIVWTDRYSGTDKPDDLGRWARVGYLEHKNKDPFKNCQIAWINKLNGKFITYVYIGSGQFRNDFTELEQAKEYCLKTVNDFYEDYLK
jgi:hypothetical protein